MPELDDVLSHYGIKGMRWGVRRSDKGGSGEPSDVIIKSRPGKAPEVSGGHNQPPSDDAKRAAAYRQKAKASTIHSLSNQELKALVDRMNLEANYAKAMAARAPQKNLGHQFVSNFLKREREAVLKGQKGPGYQMAEKVFEFNQGRMARNATRRSAQVVGQAISGKVV